MRVTFSLQTLAFFVSKMANIIKHIKSWISLRIGCFNGLAFHSRSNQGKFKTSKCRRRHFKWDNGLFSAQRIQEEFRPHLPPQILLSNLRSWHDAKTLKELKMHSLVIY